MNKKINLWYFLFIPVGLIIMTIITIALGYVIYKSTESYRPIYYTDNEIKDTESYRPIYYTDNEIKDYVKIRYGDKWKVKGEPEVEDDTIEAVGSSSDHKKYETIKKYKYTIYREDNKDYFYLYSSSKHVYQSSWTGGWSYPTEKYKKVIKSYSLSDLIELHKDDIYTLAKNNNITISIKYRDSINENEIDIHILNQQQLSNATNFIIQVYELLDVESLNIGNDKFDYKSEDNSVYWNFNCYYDYIDKYVRWLDIELCDSYDKVYNELKAKEYKPQT